MTEFPQPDITETSRPFWDGLKAGTLLFQQCGQGHRWLPARDHCPHCLSGDVRFVPAAGGARLVSWVLYRSAHHPAFESRVPYNVAIVELDEGPRMISNILCDESALRADMPLRLRIEAQDDYAVARFEPAGREKLS